MPMKTFTKTLLAAGFGSLFSLSAFAGPGAQYFQNRGPSNMETITPPTNDGTFLTCTHMLARNTGPTAHRIPWTSVQCTAEMLVSDRKCQSACGVPLAVQPIPTQLTCEHMLTSRTGHHRIPFVSTPCTPEMLQNDPECRRACQVAAAASANRARVSTRRRV